MAEEMQTRLEPGVIPYIQVDGAKDAIAFYQQALGATVLATLPAEDGERLMHGHLTINGGSFMVADTFAEHGMTQQNSNSITFHLIVDDVQAWWARATGAGMEVVAPLEKQFWGDTYGALRDRFGVNWSMGQPGS